MRVNSAFLATYAEARDGLVNVTGGFPAWWTVQSLPTTVQLSLVLVLELEGSEPQGKPMYDFVVRLVHPHGDIDTVLVITSSRLVETSQPVGAPVYQIVAAPLTVEF